MAATTPVQSSRRPSAPTFVQWSRKNLFPNWYNSVLSIIFGALFVWLGISLFRWIFVTADWEIVIRNLTLFMVGQFPREELGRQVASIILIAAAIGLLAGAVTANAGARAEEAGLPFDISKPSDWLQRFWPMLLLVVILLSLTRTITPTLMTIAALVAGVAARYLGLKLPAAVRRRAWLIFAGLVAAAVAVLWGFGGVPPDKWGGLHLTFVLTVSGIVMAFPLGLILALGRRSTLPAVRLLSVTYIEFIRGVPLITLLLMGIFALGFMLPSGVDPSNFVRILVAITLFEAAYLAENVRGGLQGVPKGQTEAAQAVGLAPWKTMRLVVLPQALRSVIPAMVGQFISLYKDTSLVYIVGITDVLYVSKLVNAQPEFFGQGLSRVTLPFVGLIYWVGSYTMSRESRRLEKKLGVGER